MTLSSSPSADSSGRESGGVSDSPSQLAAASDKRLQGKNVTTFGVDNRPVPFDAVKYPLTLVAQSGGVSLDMVANNASRLAAAIAREPGMQLSDLPKAFEAAIMKNGDRTDKEMLLKHRAIWEQRGMVRAAIMLALKDMFSSLKQGIGDVTTGIDALANDPELLKFVVEGLDSIMNTNANSSVTESGDDRALVISDIVRASVPKQFSSQSPDERLRLGSYSAVQSLIGEYFARKGGIYSTYLGSSEQRSDGENDRTVLNGKPISVMQKVLAIKRALYVERDQSAAELIKSNYRVNKDLDGLTLVGARPTDPWYRGDNGNSQLPFLEIENGDDPHNATVVSGLDEARWAATVGNLNLIPPTGTHRALCSVVKSVNDIASKPEARALLDALADIDAVTGTGPDQTANLLKTTYTPKLAIAISKQVAILANQHLARLRAQSPA